MLYMCSPSLALSCTVDNVLSDRGLHIYLAVHLPLALADSSSRKVGRLASQDQVSVPEHNHCFVCVVYWTHTKHILSFCVHPLLHTAAAAVAGTGHFLCGPRVNALAIIKSASQRAIK